jgi:hypothetical protein
MIKKILESDYFIALLCFCALFIITIQIFFVHLEVIRTKKEIQCMKTQLIIQGALPPEKRR